MGQASPRRQARIVAESCGRLSPICDLQDETITVLVLRVGHRKNGNILSPAPMVPTVNVPPGRLHRRVVWLLLPTWIALAIELIGGWRFAMDPYSGKYAIHLGPFLPLTWLALVAVVISPLLIVTALVLVFSKRLILRVQERLLPTLLLFLILSLLASMFSCVWSCGGHPTWMSGYK